MAKKRTLERAIAGLVVLTMMLAMLPMIGQPVAAEDSALIITGVIDGPLVGGLPKAVEFYVASNVTDLSIYGFGSANNGGGSDGEEFTFPADSATAGDFIYVAYEAPGFTTFFGFAPTYTSGAASINGDDAIELFQNSAVVDTLGADVVDVFYLVDDEGAPLPAELAASVRERVAEVLGARI